MNLEEKLKMYIKNLEKRINHLEIDLKYDTSFDTSKIRTKINYIKDTIKDLKILLQ